MFFASGKRFEITCQEMRCGYNRKNGLKQQHQNQNQNLLSALDIGKGELSLEMMSENNGRVKVLSSIPNNFFFTEKLNVKGM